ncbi:DUF4920 domain-containing protein [Marinicella rhabdoformis]|uniref:DUF4920 domain-containing protein n=1 Tax=Marinicella rhabdoformis TaxID=2580566 RepID=UPI0012AEBE91|nr:DUF4920 domain-containing protein [Marinicella rhabdoformis]
MKKWFVLILLCFSVAAVAGNNMTGAVAPDFKRLDQNGNERVLSEFKDKWLTLYFYPRDDTPGCTVEANEFKDKYQKLVDMNAVVIGVSMDDAESHQEFIDKYQLPFDLLVDEDKVMSKAYGVAGGMGLISYAKRQTFIIDPQGVIVKHFEEVEPKTHADDVIVALSKAQALYAETQKLADKPAKKKKKAKEVVVTEMMGTHTVYGTTWPRIKQADYPLQAVMKSPEKHTAGKRVMTGRITKVCQKMGCWMILTDGDDFARVDFNDHAFLIPKDSSGEARVYGYLKAKELSDEQIAHYQSEGAGELPKKSYEIVADSVMILGAK